MKRFWHTCLAMIATATMTAGVANAQNNWNAPSEIGSYQSILSRAGYGQETNIATAARQVAQGSGSITTPRPAGSGSVGIPNAGSGNLNSGVLNEGIVNGGEVINGGIPIDGSSTRSVPQDGGFNTFGGPTFGETVLTQPRVTQPRVVHQGAGGCSTCNGGAPAFGGAPVVSAPLVSNYVDPGFSVGNAYNGVVSNTISGCSSCGVMPGPDPGYHPPIYSAPFQVASYQPAPAHASCRLFSGLHGGGNANWVLGVNALSFARDYEDDVYLSRAQPGQVNQQGQLIQQGQSQFLGTTDADEGDFGGWGINLARRSCSGKGIEFRYWALNPDATARLDGPGLSSVLQGLQYLEDPQSGQTLQDIFYNSDSHILVRNTDINNFEVNLLNNGGHYYTRRGRAANFELFGGFRWFQFDETLSYISNGQSVAGANPQQQVAQIPTQNTYRSFVENDLVGFQLGCRNEVCLGKRLAAFGGISTGIFNNRVNTFQSFFNQDQQLARLTSGNFAGQDFAFGDQQDQVAFLSELNVGLTYQLSHSLRARFGYRALGVAGVALAADQIPTNFSDPSRIQTARTNGSLLLHGGFLGLEACF